MNREDDDQSSMIDLSPQYRSYAVWLLFLVAVCNFFDRQLINILAEPIKQELGLADWQLGMLTGLSFALLYTIAGIPIAILADRTDRTKIIGVALFLWSTFTALCGLAQSFSQLLLSRLAVGLAESGCQPPSLSLIADYAPSEKRSSAMGHYSAGIPIGGLMALAAGGIIADQFGWRAAFLIAGLPGIFLALIVFLTLRDPRTAQAKVTRAAAARPVRVCLVELSKTTMVWWIGLASAAIAMVGYGQVAFLGSFFLRVHADGLQDLSAWIARSFDMHLGPLALVGMALGLVAGLSGAFGTWIGGKLGDRLSRDNITLLLIVPGVAAPLAFPFFLLAFNASQAWLAILLLIPSSFLTSIWLGPTFAALQSVVQPDNRATAAAVQATFVLFLGLGLGPVIVGALSDFFAGPLGFGSGEGVRLALMIMSGMTLVAGGLFVVGAMRLKNAIVS